MQVLVDTSVWSLALRRPPVPDHAIHPAAKALKDLIANGSAAMLGAIRQELLSGIKTASQFAKLQAALRAFDDLELQQTDYETAAQYFNTCRSKGVQASNTDLLICAAANARGLPILTTDNDFLLYQRHLPIKLVPGFPI